MSGFTAGLGAGAFMSGLAAGFGSGGLRCSTILGASGAAKLSEGRSSLSRRGASRRGISRRGGGGISSRRSKMMKSRRGRGRGGGLTPEAVMQLVKNSAMSIVGISIFFIFFLLVKQAVHNEAKTVPMQ
jgi:hypothetical protein